MSRRDQRSGLARIKGMNPVKMALLQAIANLDEAGAMAVYNALAAHVQNEEEHVELQLESSLPGDREEGEKAAPALASVQSVVDACEASICAMVA